LITGFRSRVGRHRFSVDTGGTFTDIVVLDEETGAFTIDKAPTTPGNVLEGLLNVIRKAQLDLAQVGRFFVYGSTTALNALLERKGVKTAYIATHGFRDVPQIGRINRPEMYNPKYHKPPQIVPRDLRFEVIERLNADGEIITPLDEESVRRVAQEIAERDVRAVAVCLLHAYKNPVHELQIKRILQQLAPHVLVTISSQVAAEQREYERSTTTILNAYLAPIVERSLDDLERTLRQQGFRSDVVLTRSDGGGMSAAAAKTGAINTLLSGPAGGVIGGLYIAEITGCKNLVTADLGGTSFDVGVISNGQATANQELNAAGFPVLIPNLDIRTIGAGGGSIAWLDSAGALHVGPRSAGAQPGPMCYSRGGAEPTVTDAALVNGYIDPDYFLGGEMSVDVEAAKQGISEKIARLSGLTLPAASTGILKIALSHMAGAVRDILSESGNDPRDFGLLCYGGGGPLFAAALLEELQLASAIVPVVPANFSAWGMLMIDMRHDVVRAVGKGLNDLKPAPLRLDFEKLVSDARAMLDREGIEEAHRRLFGSLDMRYVGQGHTVSVPFDPRIADDRLMACVHESFQNVYQEVYGYKMDLAVDVVNLRIKAIGGIPKPKLRQLENGGPSAQSAIKGRRRVVDMIDGEATDCIVYARGKLLAENRVDGPAIIEEPTTLTPVRAGQKCIVDSHGNLVITRR
jgi:N-methylhydantoinase A